MSIHNIQFVATPYLGDLESSEGDDFDGGISIDTIISDLGLSNLSVNDSESEGRSSLTSSSEGSESEDESPPKARTIRVHTVNPSWTTDEDKQSRRKDVNYTDPGTPVNDDRHTDKTWNPGEPRTNKEFTFICPPTRTKVKRPIEISTFSDSSENSSSESSDDAEEDVRKPLLRLVDTSSDEISGQGFDGEQSFDVYQDSFLEGSFTDDNSQFIAQERLKIQLASQDGKQTVLNLTPNSEKTFSRMVQEQIKQMEKK